MAARLATYLVVVIVAGTLIAGLIVGAQRADESGPVDLIIHNARVYAADDLGSIADAIAIRGNKILKVGGEREVMRIRRPQTTIIDAKGAAVLPGFDDAHVALIAGGLARDGVHLFGAATLEDVQQRITAWADARPDAAWITGSGWSYDAFGGLPVRAQLDAAVSDRPAQLLSQDGQALWLNGKALAAAHITKRTPDPKHGVIVRDRRGEPTGLLKGAAMALAEKALPRPTREERAKALLVAIREAQRRGITSVQDLGAAPGDLDLYDAARDAGTLGAARLCRSAGGPHDAGRSRCHREALSRRSAPEDRARHDCARRIGRIADGGDARALYAPKGDGEGELQDAGRGAVEAGGDARRARLADCGRRRGRSRRPPGARRLQRGRQERADRKGAAASDRERDQRSMPKTCRASASLGVIATILPLHATGGGVLNWSRNLGPERAPFGWPARSLSAAGAHLAFGTDSPRLPLDPLAGLRAAVTRPGHSGAGAADAEVRDQRVDLRRGLGVVRRAPQRHAQARHARRHRDPVDRHLRAAPPSLPPRTSS